MKRFVMAMLVALEGGWLRPAGSWSQDEPQASVVDRRVKMLRYNENQVYKLTAYYGYQIDMQMNGDEEVKTIAAGDSVGWQIVGAGQHIFIKPMAERARTNLSIVTSRRTYVFDLAARAAADEPMTYLVRFQYPQASAFVNPVSAGKGAADFNFDYKISGKRALRPTRVFDDGEFTYFQFNHKRNKDLPAIFLVDIDKSESLINYRMQGDYVVVERVGEQFHLRSGKSLAVVANSRVPEPVLDEEGAP